LADGGAWVFMTIMWATMAVALLPLLPFMIDAPAGRGRRLRLIVPYACVFLGCLPWAWFWLLYPYPWLIAGAHCGLRCSCTRLSIPEPSPRCEARPDQAGRFAAPGMAGRWSPAPLWRCASFPRDVAWTG
jgi:hypothetical protein